MVQRLGNTQGLTLVELLITTSIVGMIMLGMVSIDYALRSNDQQQSRTSLVSLRTSAMMFDITSEASQAFGDVATRCIQLGNLSNNNTNYICIYQDANGNANYNAAGDAAGDQWVCYTHRATNMYKCTFTANNGPNNCGPGDQLIGTVTSDVYDAPDTPVVSNNRASLAINFQITLKNRYDPTDPNANNAEYRDTIAQEYQVNPKLLLTTQVTPTGCVP
jgi:Tfp pilus assembly protein FimT